MSEKSSKGRPAQISRKDVVECALNLGLENVSMHALGKQLGGQRDGTVTTCWL